MAFPHYLPLATLSPLSAPLETLPPFSGLKYVEKEKTDLFPTIIVQIQIHPVRLFLQSRLGLFHVIAHTVGGCKRGALALIVCLGGGDEVSVELDAVDVQILARGVGFVQS